MSYQDKHKIDSLLDHLMSGYGCLFGGGLMAAGICVEKLGGHLLENKHALYYLLIGGFLKELGIAIVILIVIGLTFDKRHRDRYLAETNELINRFKDNAFQAVFGWLVPKELLSEIEKQVLKNGFIREYFNLRYELKEIPTSLRDSIDKSCNQNSRALMEVTANFKITNMKPSNEKYTPTCFIEKEDAPGFNRLYSVRIIRDDGTVIRYNYDELCDHIIEDEKSLINNIYRLDSIELKENESIEVEIFSRAIRGYFHTREVLVSHMFTKVLTLDIHCEIKDLTVQCELISPYNIEEISIPDEKSQYCSQKKYRSRFPLLPYQGVMLWWHKEANDHGVCSVAQ